MQPRKVLSYSTIDSVALREEILLIQQHVVIASLVGGIIDDSSTLAWLVDLDNFINPHSICLHKPAGGRFHYVKFDSEQAVNKVINLSLHSFPGGEASYQSWQPTFNPSAPRGPCVPYWLSIPNLPLEFISLSESIVQTLGRILTSDIPNPAFSTHCYCVALDLSCGWISKIQVSDFMGRLSEVQVVYEDTAIQCLHCCDFTHPSNLCPRNPKYLAQASRLAHPPDQYPINPNQSDQMPRPTYSNTPRNKTPVVPTVQSNQSRTKLHPTEQPNLELHQGRRFNRHRRLHTCPTHTTPDADGFTLVQNRKPKPQRRR